MSAYFARVANRLLNVGPTLRPTANRYLVALRDDDPSVEARRRETPIRPRFAATIETPPPPAGATGVADAAGAAGATGAAAGPRTTQRAADDTALPDPLDGPAEERAIRAVPSVERVSLMPPPAREERAEPVQRALVHEPQAPRAARLFPLEPPRRSAATGLGERLETPSRVEPPSVHVHIGRIDVRAVEAPAPAKAPPTRGVLRAPSLADHLRARERGAG